MSQDKVLTILKELGGRATSMQISACAKEKYPNDTLHAYCTVRLSKLVGHGLVKRIGKNGFELTSEALKTYNTEPDQDYASKVEVEYRHGDVIDAFFFKENHIKPFEIDEETFDIYFVEQLIQSLKDGYDKSKPIVISESNIPELDGVLIDGRHRSTALQRMFERDLHPQAPPIIRERVKDLAHLQSRQIHYELHNQSKNLIYAKQRAEKHITQVLIEQPHLDTLEKTLKFFEKRGLVATTTITRIFNKHQERLEREKQRTKLIQQGIESRLPDYDVEVSQLYIERKHTTVGSLPSDDDNAGNSMIGNNVKNEDVLETNETRQRIKCPCCDKDFFATIADNRVTMTERIPESSGSISVSVGYKHLQ